MKTSSQEHLVSALLVGDYEQDRLLVQEVFRKSGWRLLEARDGRLALNRLESNQVQVVLAEARVPDGDWKSVLQKLRELGAPPQLIVTSRQADAYLWAEALNVGAFDVLARPLNRDELERAVVSARRHFNPPMDSAIIDRNPEATTSAA